MHQLLENKKMDNRNDDLAVQMVKDSGINILGDKNVMMQRNTTENEEETSKRVADALKMKNDDIEKQKIMFKNTKMS
eukprot:UN26374